MLNQSEFVKKLFTGIFLTLLFSNKIIAQDLQDPNINHSSQEIELAYVEAVLAFNDRSYPKTLEFLNTLLQKDPTSIQGLELQALTLKVLGKPKEALATYSKLLKMKPPEERGPYHFEAGTLLYEAQAYEKAKSQFARSATLNFNHQASQFFIGLCSYQLKNWNDAEIAFEKSIEDGSSDLEIAAHYYLALSYLQKGYAQGATHEFLAAKKRAEESPNSSIAKDIQTASDKALEPYKKSQTFGNISLSIAYDTNVSLINQSNVAANQVAGSKTPKMTLAAGIGKMTSPLKAFQWVGSYRTTYNQNFNSDADSYEFWTHTPSFFLTRHALKKISYGLKLEGNATLQNKSSTTNPEDNTFRPYSYSVETGPYLRAQILKRVQVTTEFNIRPIYFPGQTALGDARQSGTVYYFKTGTQHQTRSHLYNPDAAIGFEFNNTKGSSYRSRSWNFHLGNQFRLPKRILGIMGVDLAFTDYPSAFPLRDDTTWTFRGSSIIPLKSKWSLLGELSHQINSSENENFSYNKTTISIGVSYSL